MTGNRKTGMQAMAGDALSGKRVQKVVGIGLLILAACLLYGFFAGFRANLGIISTLIAGAVPGVTYGQINSLFFIFTIVNGLATPVMGYLTVKKSNLFVLVLGCVLVALGMLGLAVSSSLILFAVAIDVFLPVGSAALSFAVIFTLVSPCLGEKAAAIAAGVINCSSTLFATLLAPAITLCTEIIGFSTTCLIFAVIAVIFIPLSVVMALVHRKKQVISQERKKSLRFTEVCRTLFKAPWFYLLLACYFVYGFCCQGITNHVFIDYISAGIDEISSSMALAVANLSMTVGMLAIGFIAVKMKKHIGLISVLVVSVMSCELIFCITAEMPWVNFICMIILCVFGGAVLPVASLLTSEMADPAYVATALGMFHICGKVSQGINFQVGGHIHEITGSVTILWAFQAFFAVIAVLVILFCMKKSRIKLL